MNYKGTVKLNVSPSTSRKFLSLIIMMSYLLGYFESVNTEQLSDESPCTFEIGSYEYDLPLSIKSISFPVVFIHAFNPPAIPPSTTRFVAVVYDASSDSKKATLLTTSSTEPNRFIGTELIFPLATSSGSDEK